ncbi:MAG: hypothetical protein U1E05_25370 [Patescibacteria group bacterium]|nr:hypothetical protein [Patescibacteria group bacterium]
MLRLLQRIGVVVLAATVLGCGGTKTGAPSTEVSASAIAEEDALVHQLESQQ